uniref:Uncharacterized protein n=1 Tax=Opuntia streptacantha TaxID=393608 RepID=A0A7C8YDK0_OPUST
MFKFLLCSHRISLSTCRLEAAYIRISTYLLFMRTRPHGGWINIFKFTSFAAIKPRWKMIIHVHIVQHCQPVEVEICVVPLACFQICNAINSSGILFTGIFC